MGRFISRDPIDIWDDVNLYRYVGNNPVMFVDPSGEVKKAILEAINNVEFANSIIWYAWLGVTAA